MRDPAKTAPAGTSDGPVQKRFVWPPRQIVVPPAGSAPSKASVGVEAVPRSLWQQIESEWLGVVTPPLERRLIEAGVRPDVLNAFCWRCARTVGPYETDGRGCSHCRGTRPPWSRFVRLAEYEEPWARIVRDAKFTGWHSLSGSLGRLLGRQIRAAVPNLADRATVVVPVPTNVFRRLYRGTDHSLNLARGVSKELGVPLRPLLSRSRRPEQARLPASDRLTNLADSMSRGWGDAAWSRFGLSKAARWPGGEEFARVILVDDISTTGCDNEGSGKGCENGI